MGEGERVGGREGDGEGERDGGVYETSFHNTVHMLLHRRVGQQKWNRLQGGMARRGHLTTFLVLR